MTATIVTFVIGNLIAYSIYSHRAVPHWVDAPFAEKLLRLLWPTAIVVYLLYPQGSPGGTKQTTTTRSTGSNRMSAAQVRALIDQPEE